METNKTTKADLYKIDPRNIIVEEGFNCRVNFDLDGIKESIRENGVLNPITVFKVKDEEGNEKYRLVDGERRYRAVMSLIEEGVDIMRIPAICIPKKSDADLLIEQIVRNEGKPFNEYEYCTVCQRFLNYGYQKTEIAKKLGKNNGVITYYLDHQSRDERVQNLIKENKISGSEVRRIYAKHKGDEQGAVDEILKAKQTAEEKGKSKITLADLDINGRTKSMRVSDVIRKGIEKLLEYYEKYAKQTNDEDIAINLDLREVLINLQNGLSIDEIFKAAIAESKLNQEMKEAV